MVLSTTLSERPSVVQASAMMATPANLEILRATGLFVAAFEAAGPNDLCVAVEVADVTVADDVLVEAERLLTSAHTTGGMTAGSTGGTQWRARTLSSALRARPTANLALVSVPGEHAAYEARLALLAGLHVFLFSDNVPLTDEVALKALAAERGLLMMGPDCGTALIGGAPLGFANAVRRGPIGVVGSSGTGLQEVTSLIHRLGGGVSHALGTGSRDLYAEVGGRTFLAAVDALAADPGTRVIVAIAKPGDTTVQERVLARLAASGKPSVVYFLGGAGASNGKSALTGLILAASIEHAARCAIAMASGEPAPPPSEPPEVSDLAQRIADGLAPFQRAIRGLFAGGTLAQEAAAVILRALDAETAVIAGSAPGEVLNFGGHRVLDLGDDAFTRGRPHPLIDPRPRNAELVAQAATGDVALFLLDVVLGTGSHPDPAGALMPALDAARVASDAAGGRLRILASICGTDDDPQGFERQRAALQAAGVFVAGSSSAAAAVAGRLAATLASRAPGADR